MKLQGKSVKTTNTDFIVIPHTGEDGKVEDFVFRASAIPDYEVFDKLVPAPKPKMVQKPNEEPTQVLDDPEYLKALKNYSSQRNCWVILESLKATDDLEWETVQMNKPETWKNYRSELKDSGFNNFEIMRIEGLAWRVNSLDENMMQEARKRFLATKGVVKS